MNFGFMQQTPGGGGFQTASSFMQAQQQPLLQQQQQQQQQGQQGQKGNGQVTDNSMVDFGVMNPDQDNARDGISQISWHPDANQRLMAVSSWDGRVRLYQHPWQQMIYLRGNIDLAEPVVACSWNASGTRVLCGADQSVRMVDVQTGQTVQVGKHDAGVSSVLPVQLQNFQGFMTTSYDKTVRLWTEQQQNPIATMQLEHKVFCADVKGQIAMLGLQTEKLTFLNLANFGQQQRLQYLDSPLGNGSQIQSVALFNKGDGFGIGSIDGRANLSRLSVDNYSQFKQDTIMTFKCHKVETNAPAGGLQAANAQKVTMMYPVNAIGFNPRCQDFLYTAGSEGSMYYWDYKEKNKIRSFHFNSVPVTACATDPQGQTMAYALGYDWHEGIQGTQRNYGTRLHVHVIPNDELKYEKKQGQ